MLTIKNILLAQDFSSSAREALPYALRIAERTGATLHVLFAEVLHEDLADPAAFAASKARDLEDQMQASLDAEAPSAIEPHRLRVEHAVVRNVAAAPAILDYADEHDIDLIVMGTHGRRGVRRLLMGSVAEEVVRLSPCPVLTVRRDNIDGERGHVRSILVPVDFSKHAREALRYGKALAGLLGAHLDLLHVVEENLHPAFYGPTVQSVYDVEPDLDAKALEQLRKLYAETEGPDGEVSYTVRAGHAVREVLRFVETEGTDLIVMGTHGLTGMERFFLGSVAEKVVRQSPCPVFTVKSFGKSLLPAEAAQVAAPASADR